MRLFWRKERENERNEEDSRTNEVQSTTNGVRSRSNENDSRFNEDATLSRENSLRSKQDELDCEEAIMKDKERFGRVRNSLMKHLRARYGDKVAKRAQWRVNRRRTEGYFTH